MRGQNHIRKMFIGGLISSVLPMAVQGISSLLGKKKDKRAKQDLALNEEQNNRMGEFISDQMALQTYNNIYNEKALGGELPENSINSISSFLQGAQKNGYAEMLNSDMAKFKGASHKDGGIKLDANLDGQVETEVEGNEVMENERIYSQRLKVTDSFIDFAKEEGFSITKDSYAKIAEKLGKKKEKYELKLQEQINEAAVNTGQIMLERIDTLLNALFSDQESSK